MIDFKRIKNKILYETEFGGDNFNPEVTEAFSNEKITVERLLPSQAHKSLRVYITPDGNQMKEVEYLKKQVNK